MKEFRYKAFISYSHSDRDWAAWLLASLESYRIPRHLVGRKTDLGIVPARLTPIFRDRDELPAAQRLTDRLFEALRASEFLIVLCSPAAVKSKMVNREIAEFKKHRGEGYILYMIVGGKPFSDDPDTECFPPAVLKAIQPDGSTRGFSPEGLAADVRQDGDGKRMGLIKIVAGMIGVGLNDIVRREERRRQGQTVGIVTTAGIAVAVMGGLLYEATEARKAAIQSQSEAETRQTELQQELAFNHDVTQVLLIDIYGRMLEIGDLATLEFIVSKVIDSFEKKNIVFVDVRQFRRYTGFLLRYGQMHDRSGNSDKAKQIFEKTLAISKKFYEENPHKYSSLFRLQNNYFFLAYLAMRQGHHAEAEQLFNRQLEIQAEGNAKYDLLIYPKDHVAPPKNNDPLKKNFVDQGSELRTAYAKLLAGPLGRPAEAVAASQWAVDGYTSFLEHHPLPRRTKNSLAAAYASLGQSLMFANRMTEAEQAFEKRIKILAKMLEEDPESKQACRGLAQTQYSLAEIASDRGELKRALFLLQTATKTYDQLVEHDPNHIIYLWESARTYQSIAETAAKLGEQALVDSALKKSDEQITEVLNRDTTRVGYQNTRRRGILLHAKLAVASGDLEGAHNMVGTIILEFDAIDADTMRANGYILTAAEGYYLLSRILEAQQRSQASKEAIETAIRLIETSKATRTMELKDLLARLYARVGRKDDEALLIAELEGYGYKRLPDRAYSHPVATALTEM